ncbi:hypothetical protein [Paenibacillus flagellatus]|uniref:Uncharacterized protein n=1 Tax=Paenibacillus flagellatus TaxID=2211139 RepID=A0A2V5KFH3_9BACL|nr:hypothetical protein [Paenibacillus flagellatus]PYI56883.1 hypothetical protein DLM86_00060 [Paenibacillus flagellatus]
MDKSEIEKLEPKYTGNTRHLTEGEAYAIRNDPSFEGDDDGILEDIPAVMLTGIGNTRTD